jgi:hypothetical protein
MKLENIEKWSFWGKLCAKALQKSGAMSCSSCFQQDVPCDDVFPARGGGVGNGDRCLVDLKCLPGSFLVLPLTGKFSSKAYAGSKDNLGC